MVAQPSWGAVTEDCGIGIRWYRLCCSAFLDSSLQHRKGTWSALKCFSLPRRKEMRYDAIEKSPLSSTHGAPSAPACARRHGGPLRGDRRRRSYTAPSYIGDEEAIAQVEAAWAAKPYAALVRRTKLLQE